MNLFLALVLFASPFLGIWALRWLVERYCPPVAEPPKSPSTVLEPGDVIGGLLGIPVLLAGLCWALLGLAVFFAPLLLLWLVLR